ncbi:MAG: NAD(P)H-dependent oxidoreductase subunit E [Candidatus Riflebacteria bacterium]|nr:NAD(P)H-dependent oxidoreductase subunit E [Candidatus Riflebacteria bacterium]
MTAKCNCGNASAENQFRDPIVSEVLTRFSAGKREYLIPILQATQERLTYLSRDSMIQIAQHVGIPASKVFGVATFYNQFKLTPPGKHIIQVCRGTACHVRGSDQILRAFESELSVKAGQTTKDNLFSLDVVACLGSCSIAPVITIDGVFHGRLITKDVPRILKEFSATCGLSEKNSEAVIKEAK